MIADPGASSARTRLAWRRTALSATVVVLLAARPAVAPRAGFQDWLVAALAMTAWVLLVALGYHRAARLRAGPDQPGGRTIGAYALITVGFAALGGLVVML
ncbi:DUF202 domain-containing protein [Paractinoplanes rishiriensis]|uniref:DUF202 domain-containing protein n=1 Tax=Paractinoplanes rishiriensis TaxID=1050105 RepID=A0A919JRG4_9ACTN|nr:DUF202 domain-containing protein [Actinoplanes rishiriensis]GIE93781.1 hypothetical protein Ari01nite_12460 [Actinoplanes rishiriensis]